MDILLQKPDTGEGPALGAPTVGRAVVRGGQVWLGGSITTCGAPGTCSYPPGGIVQLQATPNAAMYFERWAHGTGFCPVVGSTQANVAFAASPGANPHCVAQFMVILY